MSLSMSVYVSVLSPFWYSCPFTCLCPFAYPVCCLVLVHTSDGDGSGVGDGSTKFHTNPVKRRRNRRKQILPFSSVPSPFYRV